MTKAPTDKELLATLNKLRTNSKLPAIKFSGTRTQLVALIEQAKKGKFDMLPMIDKVTPAGKTRKAPAAPAPKPAPKSTVEKKASAGRASAKVAPTTRASRDLPKGQFSIVQLAKELGMDPKLARSKARRHADRLPKSVAKHVYEDKHKAAVKAIISSSRQ